MGCQSVKLSKVILNTEARSHGVFCSPVCGEAADSVLSRHFTERQLQNFVSLRLI